MTTNPNGNFDIDSSPTEADVKAVATAFWDALGGETLYDYNGDEAIVCADDLTDHAVAAIAVMNRSTSMQRGEQIVRRKNMAKWQPIETAPKDGSIIIYQSEVTIAGACEWSLGNPEQDDEPCWWDVDADDECCPTHWMPFSELSEETKK